MYIKGSLFSIGRFHLYESCFIKSKVKEKVSAE